MTIFQSLLRVPLLKQILVHLIVTHLVLRQDVAVIVVQGIYYVLFRFWPALVVNFGVVYTRREKPLPCYLVLQRTLLGSFWSLLVPFLVLFSGIVQSLKDVELGLRFNFFQRIADFWNERTFLIECLLRFTFDNRSFMHLICSL